METHKNELGQAIGAPLPGWSPRPRPSRTPMEGRTCRLEPLHANRHARDLFAAYQEDKEGRNWTYLPVGPFAEFEPYRAWVDAAAKGEDPLFFAIIDKATGKPVGVASHMRIDPPNGVIEVGHINYAPRMKQSPVATETMFLMMGRVFDELGYRRYEWKCDSLNEPSRAAAARLGFTYEGMFRQAVVYKGRNRDTCWYSILDKEWPALKAAYERWLLPANFDEAGKQRERLADLTKAALESLRKS
jgi:RimJ/RimL family protein N-acetyltransferase